jgi:hypothetical protein
MFARLKARLRANRDRIDTHQPTSSDPDGVEWLILHNIAQKLSPTNHVSAMPECAPAVKNLVARRWIIGDAANADLTTEGVRALNAHLIASDNLCRYAIAADGAVVDCHIRWAEYGAGERRHGPLPAGATMP